MISTEEKMITPPSLDILSSHKREQVQKTLAGLNLTDEVAQKIREIFQQEMDLGLDINSEKKSCLQMANTFVQLPDGTEEGEYLALDLGGTNFRIIHLELVNGKQTKEIVKFYHIPDVLRTGPGVGLFDYLAECLHQFLEEHQKLNVHLSVGFTFSFPMHQKSIDCGILVSWTKSFNCSGAVGEDAVQMLNDAINRRGDLDVEVIAILNDTTGTLVQGAYLDKTTGIGLILGTGSNACYIERVDRVQDWGREERPDDITEVVIDIESGAFGDNGVLDFIKTDFDIQVDNNSLLVKSFTFEKYISGKYLGELVRVILVKLYEEKLFLWGPTSEPPVNLLRSGSFNTRLVSFIENDSLHNVSEQTKIILEELELDFGMEDVALVKYVCYLASDRAAKLVSICLAYLLDRMARDTLVTIAVDGSLFQFHPRLKSLMEYYIHRYAPERKFALMMAEDGSGKGACLIAAIASKLRKKL